MSNIGHKTDDDLGSEPAAEQPINFAAAILHAIARFPLFIIILTSLGTAGGLAYALRQPNLYASAGLLMVRLGVREQRMPDQAAGEGITGPGQSVALGDVLASLADPSLQERVVAEVGVAKLLQPYNPAAQDQPNTPIHIRKLHELQAWLMGYQEPAPMTPEQEQDPKAIAAAVDVVAAGTAIEQLYRTNTIAVRFISTDPVLSQEVATAYLDVFRERHKEIFDTENEGEFTAAQLAKAQEAEEAAEQALQAQRRKDGVHDLVAVRDWFATEVQSLRSQNDQDEIQIKSLERGLRALDAQREAHDSSETSQEQIVAAPAMTRSATYSLLLGERDRLVNERAELARDFTEEHIKDQLESLGRQIDEIQAELDRLDAQQPGATTVSTDPVLLDLIQQRGANVLQQQQLQAGIEEREVLLQQREERLAELVALEPVYAELERAVTDARRVTERLAAAHNQGEILRALDADEHMSSLRVTQQPQLPRSKTGPNRTKFLGMGIIAGLALGLGLATLRQILDSRLRYPRNVEQALGVRVLGVVPEQRRWNRRGRKLRRRLRRAMAKR